MWKPNETLQTCLGISCILLSFGASWGMVTGAVVKMKVAGADFSINEKAQAVSEALNYAEDAIDVTKPATRVNRHKLRQAQLKLEEARQIELQRQREDSGIPEESYVDDDH